METRNLFERGGLSLDLHDHPPENAIDHLHRSVMGTEGKTRYRHHGNHDRVHKQLDPNFLTLQKGEKLMGVILFSRRQIAQPAGPAEAFYIRYLSMLSTLRRQNVKGGESRRRSDGLIKKMIARLMKKPADMNVVPGNGPENGLFYAYVESGNDRSMELTQAMGFEPVGTFETVLFSRFNPKTCDSVEELHPEDLEEVRAKTHHFYRDHALFSDKNIFREGTYFAYRDGGEIVAGLKANTCHWEIFEMAGLSGKLILSLVPRIPLINRLFNPGAFKFLAFEGLWHLPGYENRLFELMEHALAEMGYYTGMLWMDRRSPLDAVIRGGHLGILQNLQSGTPADVIARFEGIPESVKQDIRERPLYISAFDSI